MRFPLIRVALMVAAVMAGGVGMRAQSAPAGAPQATLAAPQPAVAEAAAQPPASEQVYSLPPDKLAKARTLNKIRLALEIGGSLWGLGVIWLLLATRATAGLGAWAQRRSGRRWIQGLSFFSAFFVITFLAGVPVDLIGHIASRHYGISVQGWASWWGDMGKSLGLSLVFGAPGLLLFNWVVRISPRRFWLWCWVIALPILVLGTLASPVFERIYDKFEPLALHHEGLVADLEKVVARTGTAIPADRMYLMLASEKTNDLNAYVSGLGATKHIVVWDTTAGRIPNDQVMLIFAHETGHYVMNHIVKGLVASAVGLFFLFWACAGFAQWLVRRRGERWGIPAEAGPEGEVAPLATRGGFVVLLFAVSIATFIVQPVGNTISRYFEHQADVFGQEAIHGLVADPQRTAVAAFQSLGEAWLEDPDPSPFEEFWLEDHPSVQNRVKFAAHYNPWADGGRGEFFGQ